jgi:hypothetical protein
MSKVIKISENLANLDEFRKKQNHEKERSKSRTKLRDKSVKKEYDLTIFNALNDSNKKDK